MAVAPRQVPTQLSKQLESHARSLGAAMSSYTLQTYMHGRVWPHGVQLKLV